MTDPPNLSNPRRPRRIGPSPSTRKLTPPSGGRRHQFNEVVYLPAGVHPATLDEIAARSGRESEPRRAQMDSIRWLVEKARKADARRLVINGSFVTDMFEPNDVDCALLLSEDFPLDPVAAADLCDGLPFVDLHMVETNDFAMMVEWLYATDRDSVPKGVIEVVL